MAVHLCLFFFSSDAIYKTTCEIYKVLLDTQRERPGALFRQSSCIIRGSNVVYTQSDGRELVEFRGVRIGKATYKRTSYIL